MTANLISMEETLRNVVRKDNKQQSDDKLSECRTDWQNAQLLMSKKMEKDRKGTKPKVMQPTENMEHIYMDDIIRDQHSPRRIKH